MTDHPTEIQERLRQNAAKNYVRFGSAGLIGKKIPVIVCDQCGHTESCVFWPAIDDRDDVLQLGCPLCEECVVWYDLARNEVRRNRTRRRILAAAAVLIVLSAGVGTVSASRHPSAPEGFRVWMETRGTQILDLAAGGQREVVYLAPGNRETEVKRHIQEITAVAGAAEAGLLRSVHHLGELNETRLILARDSRIWRSRLDVCGWKRPSSGPASSARGADLTPSARCSQKG